MKKLLFAVLMLCSAVVNAQSESRAVASFKSMIDAASKTTFVSDVFFNQKDNGWSKAYVRISDVKYDIKKTDSVINPMVGEVSLLAMQKVSAVYASKEEAQRSEDTRDVTLAQQFYITYQLDSGKWRAASAKYETSLVGGSVPGPVGGKVDYSPRPKAQMGALDKALEKWLPGLR